MTRKLKAFEQVGANVRRTTLVALGLALAIVFFAGRVAAQGAGRVYRDPKGRFAVRVPAAWNAAPMDRSGEAGVRLTRGSATVIIGPFGGVRTGREAVASIINQFGQQYSDFKELNHGDFELQGAPAAYATFSGTNSKGVAMVLRVTGVGATPQVIALIETVQQAEVPTLQSGLQQIEMSFSLGSEPGPLPGGGGAGAGGGAGGQPNPRAGSKGAERLPEGHAPEGFVVVRDPQGTGRILAGTFQGNARSAAKALCAALGLVRGYFDGGMRVTAAVGARDDRQAMAFFEARLGRSPVRGLGILGLNPAGGGGVAILFDQANQFAASFRRLTAMLRGVQVPGGQSEVRLQSVRFPDGTGSIGVAPGWQMRNAANGAVDLAGPGGAAMGLGGLFPVGTYPMAGSDIPIAPYSGPRDALVRLTPWFSQMGQRQGLPPMRLVKIHDMAPSPPLTAGGQTAFIFAEFELGGRSYLNLALINTTPVDPGNWVYYSSSLSAPREVFAQQLPVMIEMWSSWRISQATLIHRIREAAKTMQETAKILREAAQGASEAFDRANKGWDYYIRGIERMRQDPSGVQFNTDRETAEKWAKGDPQHLVILDPSQYDN